MVLLTLDSIIAYEQDGDPQSHHVLLFFAGIFAIGSIRYTFPVVKEKGLHHVAFTLPGWGDSSPVPPSSTFARTILGDITALFDHLYTNTSNLKIYVAGGSFGTVPAQIIYGASFDVLPLGRNVAGMMLLASLSPFRVHKNYAKSLSWRDWIGVSPLTIYVPIPSLLSLVMGSKFGSVESSEQMLRQILFDRMDEAEKEKFTQVNYHSHEGHIDLFSLHKHPLPLSKPTIDSLVSERREATIWASCLRMYKPPLR
jgi:hypothetical protein